MKPFKDLYIAVVGVSEDPSKYGHKVFSDMIKAGWYVDGINLKGGEVEGRTLFTSLKELKNVPELVVTVVPPGITEAIVDEAHDIGVKHIWMQPGSESEKVIAKAKKFEMKVDYNQCIMIRSGLW